jgi:siroheme synthase (precorrin-2 oxidase/ferrochelatase)
MKYFPIFIHLERHRVVIAGDTNAVVAKARLLSKSAAQLHIYTSKIDAALETLVAKKRYPSVPRIAAARRSRKRNPGLSRL